MLGQDNLNLLGTIFSDSNYAFSNALLGNFNSYSEANLRTYSHYRYLQSELYAQDSWRASRKLTVELGVRVVAPPPKPAPCWTASWPRWSATGSGAPGPA